MADYFSILNKTISGLPSNTAETRAFVYAKARQAIESRLKAISPPPGKEAIAKQMQTLEEAVRRIEAEQVLQELMAPPEIDSTSTVQVQPQTAPKPQAAPQPHPQPNREAMQVELRSPVPAKSPPPAGRNGNANGVGTATAREAPQPRVGPPAYDSSLDSIDSLDRASGRPGKVRRAEVPGKRRSGGGWLGALLSFLMLAALAAGAYGLWLNKEPLMAALGIEERFGLGESAEPEPQQQAEQNNQQQEGQSGTLTARESDDSSNSSNGSSKEDIRLDESGRSVPGQQTDAGKSGQNAASADQSGAGEQAQSGEVNPVNESQQNADQQSSGDQAGTGQAGTGTAAAPAIGQKAFLYEEGSAGAGATRDNAAVVWSLAQEPPAEGQPPEAVIHGQLDVPGRGLTLQLSIKRNTDEALPASHVIELLFTVPSDFSGGNIDNVARFVMKANEQARGEGLVAVPARIDAGYFLIALNNLPQAVETNRKLLLESSWIDVPLGYTSGRRALVALEKGAIGDKVFRDAFADWDKR